MWAWGWFPHDHDPAERYSKPSRREYLGQNGVLRLRDPLIFH